MEEADEHNFTSSPEPSLGRVMDDFLSSFVFLQRQLKRNLPTETKGEIWNSEGNTWPAQLFCFLVFSAWFCFHLRCYLYIMKLAPFKCRV